MLKLKKYYQCKIIFYLKMSAEEWKETFFCRNDVLQPIWTILNIYIVVQKKWEYCKERYLHLLFAMENWIYKLKWLIWSFKLTVKHVWKIMFILILLLSMKIRLLLMLYYSHCPECSPNRRNILPTRNIQ